MNRTFLPGLTRFLFPAAPDQWLVTLRVGLGIQVVLYCLSESADWNHFFALDGGGLVNRELAEAILTSNSPFIPRLGWLVAIGQALGLSEQNVLFAAWGCLCGAGVCLVAGLFCRISAITAWFLYLCAAKSGQLLAYGVDHFTTIGLFYLMLAPFPDRYALDRKIWKKPIRDTHLHGFFKRVLQLHLCVIYFSGGISKAFGLGWWTGESIWRALTRPPFNMISSQQILSWEAALPLLGISVWVLEAGYPFLIWPKRTRFIWLAVILAMHVAIGLAMGLYLFSLVMIVLNLAGFGPEMVGKQGEGVVVTHQTATV